MPEADASIHPQYQSVDEEEENIMEHSGDNIHIFKKSLLKWEHLSVKYEALWKVPVNFLN